MRVSILGSGSGGNALLVDSGSTRVLIDAGLSHRELLRRFALIGSEAPTDIAALIVTHGHHDHAAHAHAYATRFGCPLRATEETLRAMPLRPSTPTEAFVAGRTFRVGDISIRSRRIPHDVPQVALVFETKRTTVGLATDLGHVCRGLARFLEECETLLLESNHDEELLAAGPYPPSLKRRVAGRLGHLSNAQAGDLLAELGAAPREVVLMHLSETNNSPRFARNSAEAAIDGRRTRLRLAEQRRPTIVGDFAQTQLPLWL